jgi:hypothetical protein
MPSYDPVYTASTRRGGVLDEGFCGLPLWCDCGFIIGTFTVRFAAHRKACDRCGVVWTRIREGDSELKKAVAVVSGGLDSVTLAHLLHSEGWTCICWRSIMDSAM